MKDCLGHFIASVIVGLSCRKQLVFFVCGSLRSSAVFVIQNVCPWMKSPRSDVPITFPHARTRVSCGGCYSDESARP